MHSIRNTTKCGDAVGDEYKNKKKNENRVIMIIMTLK